ALCIAPVQHSQIVRLKPSPVGRRRLAEHRTRGAGLNPQCRAQLLSPAVRNRATVEQQTAEPRPHLSDLADSMRAVMSGRCEQPHESKEAARMATYLYRLGGWSFENRRKVLLAWLLLLGVVGFCALTFSGHTSEKFDGPGTESQKARQLLEDKFPEASGAYARVVYEAPAGQKLTDPENRRAIVASIDMARKAKDVMMVIDPFTASALSADKRIAYTDVIYPV